MKRAFGPEDRLMLGGLGAPELIVIALIALLLFGAGRIADIGKGLGQGIKNFKQGLKEAGEDEDEEEPEKVTPKKAAKKEKAEAASEEA
jgi:sec-independent protein translocase protein TatA